MAIMTTLTKAIHVKLKVLSLVFVSFYSVGLVKNATQQASGFADVHEESLMAPHPPRLTAANKKPPVKADGVFNGFDLHKVDRPPRTDIHCIGENFQEDMGYVFRSCKFETFCFDTKLNDFVVYPEKPLNGAINDNVWSSTHNPKEYTTVAAGAQSRLWWPVHWNDKDGKETRVGKFQPRFVYADDDDIPTSYYRFNATWLPFYRHQRSPYNPGEYRYKETDETSPALDDDLF